MLRCLFSGRKTMQERLQKIISAAGIMSRRAAEKAIEEGKVSVNGEPAFLGMKADPETDTILVNGKRLSVTEKKIVVMLNKPAGYVTTMSDEKHRKIVTDLIREIGERLYPVGRLDMYSEGLLLLTNDGELANALMHPSREIRKTYLVKVRGEDLKDKIRLLRSPIDIDGRRTTPARVTILSADENEAELTVTIVEGRNRQIRRLCEAAELKVLSLKRIAEGPLQLEELKSGRWRYLTEAELQDLRKEAGLVP